MDDLQLAIKELRQTNRALREEIERRQQAENALGESEARYRSLFENMSSGVVVYKPRNDGHDFVFLSYNRAAEKISGYKREEVIGRSVLELFPPVEEFGIVDVFRRVWQSGEPEYLPVTRFQEGSYAGWIENYVYKLPSGEIVAIFDDVTARKVAEDQLKEQKELLESTIEALDHPFCVIHAKDFSVEIANSAARSMSASEKLTTCYALAHRRDKPCSGPDHICPLEQVMRTREPVIVEHTHYHADGQPYPVEVRGYPLFDQDGNVERLIEYALDITERKRMERAVKEGAARGERERLARDLHDAVSQNLFSAGLITELLPELWERDQAEVRPSLDKLRQLIRATSAEMRTMLLELRPDSLLEAELDFLLRHLSESLSGRSGVNVTTALAAGCAIPDDVKIACYRVVQEAFNNIARHAQAQEVSIISRCENGTLEIIVQDDGRGFDPRAIPPGHLGVGIMHERAVQIGGTLVLKSTPDQGTQINLSWQKKMGVSG